MRVMPPLLTSEPPLPIKLSCPSALISTDRVTLLRDNLWGVASCSNRSFFEGVSFEGTFLEHTILSGADLAANFLLATHYCKQEPYP